MSTAVETQALWSTASSVTVSSSTVVWSDVISIDANDGMGWLQVHVDNAGTPTSGDVCDVYVARTAGDILENSANDFDTTEHATWLMRLDTVAANTPGEDPARRTVMLPVAGLKEIKIGLSCPQAASRNIAARARLTTQRG